MWIIYKFTKGITFSIVYMQGKLQQRLTYDNSRYKKSLDTMQGFKILEALGYCLLIQKQYPKNDCNVLFYGNPPYSYFAESERFLVVSVVNFTTDLPDLTIFLNVKKFSMFELPARIKATIKPTINLSILKTP